MLDDSILAMFPKDATPRDIEVEFHEGDDHLDDALLQQFIEQEEQAFPEYAQEFVDHCIAEGLVEAPGATEGTESAEDAQSAAQGLQTEEFDVIHGAGKTGGATLDGRGPRPFVPSPIAPQDLLTYEPGMGFQEYLDQKTHGRYVTPSVVDSVIAAYVARILQPVLRYATDTQASWTWTGDAWESNKTAVSTAVQSLISPEVQEDGSTRPAKIRPADAITDPDKRDKELSDAAARGWTEQRDDQVFWRGTDAEFVPFSPAPAKVMGSTTMVNNISKQTVMRSDLQIHETDFDQQASLLPCPGMYINLETMKFTDPKPDALVTRIAGGTPYGEAFGRLPESEWMRFLESSLPDQEMRIYLQTAVGAALDGSRSTEFFFALTGTGSNGKSVFITVLQKALGGLARVINDSVIQESNTDRHPTELMSFRGTRVAVVSETARGKQWDAEKIKRLTSGETIVARGLYKDEEEFDITHTLFLATNHRPKVAAGDPAFWRRYSEINMPMTFVTSDRPLEEGELRGDPDLQSRLLQDLDVVLAWGLQGLRMYQQQDHKFIEPKAVTEARAEAMAGADMFAGFLAECFEKTGDKSDFIPKKAPFMMWREYLSASSLVSVKRPTGDGECANMMAEQMKVTQVQAQGGKSPAGLQGVKITAAGAELLSGMYIPDETPKVLKKWIADNKESVVPDTIREIDEQRPSSSWSEAGLSGASRRYNPFTQ